MKDFKAALCQMKVAESKQQNIKQALKMIDEAAMEGADLAILPEMFNCPYSNKYFREYAEDREGMTVKALSQKARERGIYIIGGSIPEIEGDKVYNSSMVFDRKGNIIACHRKVHLFDIDIKGKIRFKESDTLSPGKSATVFDTEFGKIGVAICYDIRFPELFRKMVLMGAEVIIVPGAFNMTTGPAHWEMAVRSRAVDNQVYMMAVSPARDENGCYVAYGNSMIADPWGNIVSRAGAGEEIITGAVDGKNLEDVRSQLPLLRHRRPEIY